MVVRYGGGYPAARLRAPGVYIEHGVEPLGLGFETGVPLFVGFASEVAFRSKDRASTQIMDTGEGEDASHLALFRIESIRELSDNVAEVHCGYLLPAVRGFFQNGGKRCVVAVIDVLHRPLDLEVRHLFEVGGALELVEDVDLVCVPDALIDSIAASPGQVLAIQHEVLAYCERMGDRFAILDAPRSLLESSGIVHLEAGSSGLGLPLSPNGVGAIYAPWIGLSGGGTDGSVRMVPPCGHVAGVYARTDRLVGPHQSPANAVIEGAVDLAIDVSDTAQSRANDLGVNCLRSLPGRGIRVWGARTLSSRPGWRYVNVRRIFLTLTRWLEVTMTDLVMEPNNESTWAKIRYRINAYCGELMKRGALAGSDANEAYVVKCDAETNPPEVRERGMLVTEIGLAAVVPAEFIFVRVTQSANGTAATPMLG